MCIYLLWVDLMGNLSLEERFMQPVLQGIFLPLLLVAAFPVPEVDALFRFSWALGPEASDFFQSTNDQKSSEVS